MSNNNIGVRRLRRLRSSASPFAIRHSLFAACFAGCFLLAAAAPAAAQRTRVIQQPAPVAGSVSNCISAEALAFYAAPGTTLSCLPTANNGVAVTDGSGNVSIATTLPSGLAIPSPALSGTVTGNGTIPNAVLAFSSLTIGSTAIALGASSTTLGGLTGVTLTSGSLTGDVFAFTANTTAATGNGFFLTGANNIAISVNGIQTADWAAGTVTLCCGGNNGIRTLAGRNVNSGAAAALNFNIGNNTSASQFQVAVLSSANAGGNGANSATVTGAGGLFLAGGSTTGLKLDTSGQIFFVGQTTTSGALTGFVCYNSATPPQIELDSGASCLASSERYKSEIADLDAGLATALALRPVSYRYSERAIGALPGMNLRARQPGLLAEEVERIDPRLVTYDSHGVIHAVRYEQLTAVLVKAVQEVEAQIARLARTVDPHFRGGGGTMEFGR